MAIPVMSFFLFLLASKVLSSSEADLWRPDYAIYHQKQALLEEVNAIAANHPSRMSLEVQRVNASGYSAEVLVVTLADDIHELNNPADRIRVLLNFGQHGRELITSEVALRLLHVLSGDYESNRQKVLEVLTNTVFKIVPLENSNGREIVEKGNFCERRNGRGVDTNRNWDVNWGKKEKDYDPAEEYPGVRPFSEPEAQILHNLARDFKPHLWVNVHSGMEALFMPYDHKNTTPADGSAELVEHLLQTVNKIHCDSSCKVGSGGASVGYLAHGTATDYMYDVLKVPVALTFEIYGDTRADDDDCFKMFNPTTPQQFESVVSNWSLAFLTLVSNLPQTLRSLANTKSFALQHRKMQLNNLNSSTDTSRTVLLLFQLQLLLSSGLLTLYVLSRRCCLGAKKASFRDVPPQLSTIRKRKAEGCS